MKEKQLEIKLRKFGEGIVLFSCFLSFLQFMHLQAAV